MPLPAGYTLDQPAATPNLPAGYKLDNPSSPGRPDTSGSMALDFMQGGGAELIKTALGTYELLRKIPGVDKLLPAVSDDVRQYAEPPHTVAAKAGGLLTTLAEFAVPAGEAGALTKGAGLLERSLAQGVAAGGTQLARTGGNLPSAADTAALGAAGPVAGAVLGAAAPVAGRVIKAAPSLAADAIGVINPRLGNIARVGIKAFKAAANAAEKAEPEVAAAASVKSPGQLLAESDGKTWAGLGKPEKQVYEQIANLKPKFEANAAADQPTASQQAVPRGTLPAAEAPPPTPTQSSPVSVQPAPAAAPIEQLKTSGRTFIKDPRPSAEDYTLVQVPTAKLDAGWAKEGPAFYIPPGGGGAEIGGRLPAAKQFIESGQPIEAPRVAMAENGRIAFEDGRHRFAAVRDAGDKTTAVMVPNEQVADFEALNKPSSQPAAGPQTPADIAIAKNAKAKADRFIGAIQRYNIDFPDRHPITSKGLENLGDAEKSILTRQLKNGGYLKNTEEFTDTSFPYIVQGLKDAESGGNLAQQLAESIRRARANRASAGR